MAPGGTVTFLAVFIIGVTITTVGVEGAACTAAMTRFGRTVNGTNAKAALPTVDHERIGKARSGDTLGTVVIAGGLASSVRSMISNEIKVAPTELDLWIKAK